MQIWIGIDLNGGMAVLDVVGDAVGACIAGTGRVAEEALPQRVVGQVYRSAVLDEDIEHFIGRLAGLHGLFARFPAAECFTSVAALHSWFNVRNKFN